MLQKTFYISTYTDQKNVTTACPILCSSLANTALSHGGIDSIKSQRVSSGLWHKDVSTNSSISKVSFIYVALFIHRGN